MKILIRLVISAIALWVAQALVDGIDLTAGSTARRVLTLLAVAAIFGVINAFLKPVIQVLGCAFYILTLGLFALLVNAALLMLTSWIAGKLNLPFHVDWFWPAFWGAIIIGVVSWLLNMFVADEVFDRDRDGERG
ncbi:MULTISPECIES: phage holin family protein [Actinomadura]|uniref:Phage holin family protein n=1 Tax=Actinomadura litoris TaxID=2678616 RepID=A0A7K1L6X4_9ACTN|nr:MULTISPECIES: phage holin family protein [Actinomadura]MBT2209361.1 phage holin family protein [Actinomadura sp. NEAU-AAG7]MUN40053.1 phage holin family protein [Actinomadura litoris]